MDQRIIVSTLDELKTALATATGGETIELAAGDHGTLELNDLSFAETVTITSADPEARAVLDGQLKLTGVENLAVVGIDIRGTEDLGAGGKRVALENSARIRLADMTIAGAIPTEGLDPDDPDATQSDVMIGVPRERAMSVMDSRDIVLDGLEVRDVWKGVSISGSEGVAVRNSEFHSIRSDGINLGGSREVLIENNYMHDFSPWYGPNSKLGDHPDMIQYFGGALGLGLRDITIRDNVLMQGEGGQTQGIFGHVGQGIEGPGAFSGFTITGNFVQTGHKHGIYLGDTTHALIAGNLLLPSAQQATGESASARPTVVIAERIEGFVATDITVRDNVLTHKFLEELDTANGMTSAELTARAIAFLGNEVLETGSDIPAHWIDLPLPPVPVGGDLAGWIAEVEAIARGVIAGEGAATGTPEETLGDTLAAEEDPGAPLGTDPVTEPAEEPEPEPVPDLSGTEDNDLLAGGKLGITGQIWVEGLAGNDRIFAGYGDDRLDGGDGGDRIHGQSGDDRIYGGAGNDRLFGARGNDELTGGEGADLFGIDGRFSELDQTDTITDLNFAEGDRIALFQFDEGTFAEGEEGKSAQLRSLADIYDLARLDNVHLEIDITGDIRLVVEQVDGTVGVALGSAFRAGPDAEDISAVLAGDMTTVDPGGAVVIDVLANDAVGEGALLTGHSRSLLGARVEIVDGKLEYTAAEVVTDAPFVRDTVIYGVADGAGGFGLASVDILVGTRPDATATGTDAAEKMSLTGGDDIAGAGDGNDQIWARDGDDWLDGGAGNDWLIGGAGSDMLIGGTGSDRFRFDLGDMQDGARDTIADLDFAEGDLIRFMQFGAGRFAGDFDALTARNDGDTLDIASLAALAELSEIDGMEVARTARDRVSVSVTGEDGGTAAIDILLTAEQGAGLDTLGLGF